MVIVYDDFSHGVLGLGRWSLLINGGLWTPRNFDILIIEFLQYAMQGRVSKILLGVPSRHGKSTLISKNFCSYFLSHYPDEQIILSSYSQGLASEFGGAVKTIINTYGHLSPYNVELSIDSKAKNKFHLAEPYKGQMLAVGAGGSILGFGAGLFIVDDPIKSITEAESKTTQRKLKSWFTGTAKTRLQKRTNGMPPIMIVIAQRLHIKDLHGIIRETEPVISGKKALQMLREGETIDPNTWVDINLPAICEDPEEDLLGRKQNEVLWKEQRDYEWLMKEKEAMGSYQFNAIYQGEPIEREGNIFKREWFYDDMGKFKYWIDQEKIPAQLPEIRYWDTATGGEKGDETAGTLTSYDGEYVYVLDIHNNKYTAGQLTRNIIKQANKDGKKTNIKIEYEGGSQTRAYVSDLQRNPKLRGYMIRGDDVRKAGPKNIRSSYLEIACEMGKIKFSRKIPRKLVKKVVEQLISFTGEEGNTDDLVDSLSGSVRHWKHQKVKINV